MSGPTRLIGAVAAGAAAMYLLDPDRGRRRRALARDKIVSATHRLGDASAVTARDLANRTRGLLAEARALVLRRPASDEQIAERVRSTLGFVVRHPRSVDVRVDQGRVILTGPVLADEVDRLLAAVASIRDVRQIENHLRVHTEPGSVPGLQGEPARRGAVTAVPWMQEVWSPTVRLLAGTAGAGLALWGLRRGGLGGAGAGLGGLALFLRGVTNLPLRRITGLGAGPRAVTLQKTITIGAPVEQVFEAWSRYEDFPKFMSRVREVRRAEGGRSHWVVTGPGGVPIEWDTEESAYVPGRLIGWRTVPGSSVEHAGIVRFDPNPEGGTRVHIRTSWNPPVGAIGYGVAAILGGDPGRALDEDLVRFKSLVEQGKTTAHGGTVTREEIAG